MNDAPDKDCYTLPNGECVTPNCSLHGPLLVGATGLRCICATHYDEATGYPVIPKILKECPHHQGVHPAHRHGSTT